MRKQFLEPVIRNVVFDERNEIRAFTPEQLYAGFLGAATSMVMNSSASMQGAQKLINRKVAFDKVMGQFGFAKQTGGVVQDKVIALTGKSYGSLTRAQQVQRSEVAAALLTGKASAGVQAVLGLSKNPIVQKAQLAVMKTKSEWSKLFGGTPMEEFVTPEGVRIKIPQEEPVELAKTGTDDGYVFDKSGGGKSNGESGIIGETNENRGKFDFKNPMSFENANIEDVESYLDTTLGAYTKVSLKKGKGIRYFDGKGNSWQLNQGYENATDSIHGGPYLKTTLNGKIIRIPLK